MTSYLKVFVVHGILGKSNVNQRTLMAAEAGARAMWNFFLLHRAILSANLQHLILIRLWSIVAIPVIKSKIPGSPQCDSWSALLQAITWFCLLTWHHYQVVPLPKLARGSKGSAEYWDGSTCNLCFSNENWFSHESALIVKDFNSLHRTDRIIIWPLRL